MDERLKLISKSLGEERVKFNEDLSSHTYLNQKVFAASFYIATTTQELIRILDLALELDTPFLVIGGGTKFSPQHKLINGLVIKNRTSNIKIGGIKGKVGKGGIGVEEALVMVDSGVSLAKLNSFLATQNLRDLTGFSSLHSTVGGAIFVDLNLQELAEKITIWSEGMITDTTAANLDIKTDIVIFVIFKVKAK